jgi:hypothetical protein
MRMRWLGQTPPLSPPPSEDELTWWRTIRGKIGLKIGLMQALPFVAVFAAVAIIRGRTGIHLFVVVPLLGVLLGLIQWKALEKHLRSQHIRWKRVREDLGAPSELP